MSKIGWKKLKYGDLLKVSWDDIVSVESWISEEDAQEVKPAGCISVGWLISNETEVIRLAATVSDLQESSVIVIPKGCITAIKVIQYDRNS